MTKSLDRWILVVIAAGLFLTVIVPGLKAVWDHWTQPLIDAIAGVL